MVRDGTPGRRSSDPRIDRAISWVLGLFATVALSWSVHAFSSLNDGIGSLKLEVMRLTTQMEAGVSTVSQLRAYAERIEERLRAVEKIR